MSDQLDQHSVRALGYQHDVHQRYAGLGRLLTAMFPTPTPVRVLDVGCGPAPLTAEFLPPRFAVHRADVQDFGDSKITVIEAAAPLPFADRAFDVVIAMDVLEHLPAGARRGFAAELARTAGAAVVLAFPDGRDPGVAVAEAAFGEVFRAAFGRDNAFLLEHRQHGLPRADEVAGWLDGFTCGFAADAPLEEWLLWNALDAVHCARFGDGPQKAAFNARVNALCPGPVVGATHYRAFVVAARDAALRDRALAGITARPRAAALPELLPVLLPALVALEAASRDGSQGALAAQAAHVTALQRVADDLADGLRKKDAHIAGLQKIADDLAAALRAKDQRIEGLEGRRRPRWRKADA